MNIIYTALLLLATVCYVYSTGCPPHSEDTYMYKEFKDVKGEVELDLHRGSGKTPPVIAVRVIGGQAKVGAEVGGKKVHMGTSEGKNGEVHFKEPTHTDKLFFTPESGTSSFDVSVTVCYI